MCWCDPQKKTPWCDGCFAVRPDMTPQLPAGDPKQEPVDALAAVKAFLDALRPWTDLKICVCRHFFVSHGERGCDGDVCCRCLFFEEMPELLALKALESDCERRNRWSGLRVYRPASR